MTHLTQSFSLLADVPNRIAASETIKALSKLSNAELHDIGISRGEIHDVAIRTHYGER
jgi:uncharacterized protein YjiS (DUF1127 family)